MSQVPFWSVFPWVTLAIGIVLITLAYVRYDEVGRLTGAGAAILICSVVFLAGIQGTPLGSFLFTGGALLGLASSYAMERERKRQRKLRRGALGERPSP